MIRILRAMVWLRLRLLANSVRPTRRRDGLEHASRVFQVLGPVLLVLLLIPGIVAMGFLGFLGGWLMPAGGESASAIRVVLRLILGFEILLAALAPLLRSAQGSVPNITRFLLLPIPPGSLYLSEAAAGLADPWLALAGAGLLLLPAGLLPEAGFTPALLALLAGLAILALLAELSAFCSTAARMVFRDRRRGEAAAFVLLTAIAVVGMLPGFLASTSHHGTAEGGGASAAAREAAPGADARAGDPPPAPVWALAYPPEIYVQCVSLAAAGRPARATLFLVPLLLQAGLVHLASSRLHRRLLETPEVQSRRRGSGSPPRQPILPLLSPAASAVALNQLRLVFRTVQGKISLCLTPVTVLTLGWVLHRLPAGERFDSPVFPGGILLASLGVIFSLLTLESATLNQFAMDRAGLTLTFLSPLSDRDLLRGKAAGTGLLAASRAVPCILAAGLVAPGGSPWLWLSVPVAGTACYLLLAAGGALLSAIFPKSMDLSRIGQAGKPHALASLFGMILLAGAALPAAGLGMVALLVLESPLLLLGLMLGWAAVAALISMLLFRAARAMLDRRRENLLMVAQGR